MRKTELIVSGEIICPKTKASIVAHEHTNVEALLDQQNRTSSTITQTSAMSQVGVGDDMDLSFCVEDGFYESATLYGKTMVNCIQEPSSKDVVLPYAFEDGQYVTINDTKESGALGVELKGQTLVNIHDKKTPTLAAAENDWYSNLVIETNSISFTVAKLPENWRYISFKSLNLSMLKPNTKYLVAFEEASGVSTVTFKNGDSTHPLSDTVQIVSNKAIVTTTSDWVNSAQILYIYVPARNVGAEVKVKNPMIIEYVEGMENWDIPYFTGMTSCKMPILKTIGKNLFNENEKIEAFIESNSTQEQLNLGVKNTWTTPWIKAKTNTSYTMQGGNRNRWQIKSRNNVITFMDKKTITTLSDTEYIRCYYCNETYTASNVQLEESSSATSYEPYKSSILSLPEEVVLRSLPNGVRDTFNTRTGVYTQRIGEIVLDGTESDWESFYGNGGLYYFRKPLPSMIEFNNQPSTPDMILGDRVCFNKYDYLYQSTSISETLMGATTLSNALKVQCVYIYYNNVDDIDVFKQYLQSNPITIQYQLETPIVTKINLPSTLKSWNTTTHIYSEIPKNTLYPTLSHSNPTYPVILKPSTKYSIVVNSYSNSHTNSAINFNLGGATASTTVGNRVTTITTPSTLSNELLTMSGRGNKLNHVMVIEGDVVGDEPYFEGICDCQSPILSNVGKNLFNGESRVGYYTTETGIYNPTPSITQCCNITPIQVSGGTKYSFLLPEGDMKNGRTFLYDSKMNFITSIINADVRYVITTTQNTKYINFHFDNATPELFSKVQLEESSSATSYEPYKSNTTTFDQKDGKTIVLRSLPNGVCDTLNVETGEYVQRIGEVVCKGDSGETWSRSSNSDLKTLTSHFKLDSIPHPNSKSSRCNTLPYESNALVDSETPSYKISGEIWLNVLKSNLVTDDANGLKKYLKTLYDGERPIIIQYELAAPVIKTVDLSGFPFSYANGHVQLSSGSIEQSLTPKVEYVVQTNRAGAIQANQDRLLNHDKRLAMLEDLVLHQLIQLEYNRAKCTFLSQTRQIFEGGIQMYHTKYELLSEFIEKKLYRSLEEVFEMLDVYFMLGDISDGEYDALYEALMPSTEEIFEVEETFDHEDVEV